MRRILTVHFFIGLLVGLGGFLSLLNRGFSIWHGAIGGILAFSAYCIYWELREAIVRALKAGKHHKDEL